MKKLGFVAAAVALSAVSAFAADLPSRKEAPLITPPPPPMWTGFYGGLNAGYGWGTSNDVRTAAIGASDVLANSFNNAPSSVIIVQPAIPGATALASSGVANVEQSGFVGGGQFGYNYQYGSSLVLGAEIDMQGAGIRGAGGNSAALQEVFSYSNGRRALYVTRASAGASQYTLGVDWIGTVRGRIGWLATPALLVYGTGGFAYGGAHASASHALSAAEAYQLFGITFAGLFPTVGGAGRHANVQTGWTAGGGFEWMVMPNWSLKAEALYYDLGSMQFASSAVGALDFNGQSLFANVPVTRVRYDGVIARAGVNYHLNLGSVPVIAGF